MNYLTQDWGKNKGYSKGKLLTLSFRIASCATKNKILKYLLLPYLMFYKFGVEWILGIEIPYNTKIGQGLVIFHGVGLIIHKNTIIGKNCILRHSTTLGNKGVGANECPIVGNNVNVGSNVCILGNIKIGDNSIIGAGSIVVKDVPPNAVVAGNPARIVKYTC